MAHKTIDQMIDDVIRREGGYVDHPADRGGPTKYGITQAAMDAYTREHGFPPVVARLIHEADAHQIYKVSYYRQPGIDKLPPDIQPFVFDSAVNHGAPQAIKFVQQGCNLFRTNRIAVDGICGPATQSAAESAYSIHRDEFLYVMLSLRLDFYKQIVEHDPSQYAFWDGWMNRLDEFYPNMTSSSFVWLKALNRLISI
jgi:lysozyme family protein